jgi:uncharacterized protein (TIGR02594 family)
MSTTRIITDVPQAQVNFVVALIEADGGTVERHREASGKVTIVATFADRPALSAAMPAEGSAELEWMKFAREEEGQAEGEGEGGASNPRIEAYHATTKGGIDRDSVPWCSSFVNFCVEKAGLQGTKSKSARSWLRWGVEAPDFVPGCIVVLKRGSPPQGHVGFYVGQEEGFIRLLGGNQGNQVGIASFDIDRVIGRRVPAP